MRSSGESRRAECLLVQPAFGYWRGCHTPVGLGILASILRNAGHAVGILDARLGELSPEEAAERIVAGEPRVVGFTSMTATFPWARRPRRWSNGRGRRRG